MTKKIWLIALILTSLFSFGQAADPIKTQLLAQVPAALINSMAIDAKFYPDMSTIPTVQYFRADYDRTSQYNYIVALYCSTVGGDAALRVFKNVNGQLQLAGDTEEPLNESGEIFGATDLDDDGLPEVLLASNSSSGDHTYITLYKWTGSSLHNVIPDDVDTQDAYTEDVDGNGTLALVVPPYDATEKFKIYEFNGTDYEFSRESATEPAGLSDANGDFAGVVATCKLLEPASFPLSAINNASSQTDDGRVTLTFGGLQQPQSGSVSLDQVDTTSIRLSGVGSAVNVSALPSGNGAGACSSVPIIRAQFSRNALLRQMGKSALTGPLTDGATVNLEFTAALKAGNAVHGKLTATVIADQKNQ